MPEIPGAITAEIATRKFGGPTLPREYEVVVGTDLTELVRNNPRRVGLLLVNRGSARVDVSFQPSFQPGKGFLLAPDGGSISLAVDEDGEAVAWALYGRSTVAGQAVWVVEIERL